MGYVKVRGRVYKLLGVLLTAYSLGPSKAGNKIHLSEEEFLFKHTKQLTQKPYFHK